VSGSACAPGWPSPGASPECSSSCARAAPASTRTWCWPLLCAVGVAGYQILTRKLAGHDNPITTLFFPGLIAIILVPAIFPGSFFVVPSELPHGLALFAAGTLGAIGHFLLIRAHHHAPATMLAPFGYAQLVVALVLGWLLFAQLPDGVALAGIALIAGSGLGLILASHRARWVRKP
jgi:drug/metabolite transporter (DMT)-like permease